MNRSTADNNFARQDIGYLLTAYADGQLAPEGVMWVEEQLDGNADLRGKLKEIRQLQAGLRAAFAGGAPDFVLDLPRREALLASAAHPPRKKIRFQPLLWSGLAASLLAFIGVALIPMSGEVREMAELTAEARERFYRQPEGEALASNSPAYPMPSAAPMPAGSFDAQKPVDALAEIGISEADKSARPLNQVIAKNDEEVADPHEQNRAVGGELAERRRGLTAADSFGANIAPESLAKREKESLDRDGARKSYAPTAPATPAPEPAPVQPAEEPALAKAEAKAAPADDAAYRYLRQAPAAPAKPVARPSSAAAPATTPPPAPPAIVPAQEAQQLARVEGRTAGAPGAAPQGGRADGKERGEDKPTELKALDKLQEETVTKSASFAGVGGGAGPSVGEKAKGRSADGLERGADNGKSNAVEASKDVALRLNVQLAKAEDDYNIATVAQAQREEQKKQAEKAGQDGRLQAAAGKQNYPKIYAELADEKASTAFLKGVVGSVRNNPQGQQDLLMLTLGKGDVVEPGTEFIVFRGNNYIVRAKAEKVLGDMVACRVVADSWNANGLQIQNGDFAQNRIGGEESHPSVDARSLLNSATAIDPQLGFAALRSSVTVDGVLPLAQSLRLIAGDQVGFTLGGGIDTALTRQVQVSLRDEPMARGILRAVRSAGLQAQFTGGLVKLDPATHPLDPSDAQGMTLAAFKDLLGTQPMQATAVDPIQTVAIDADTASYEYAKARVASGQPIDAATIKPEHFINAMPMDYPAAQGPEAFSLYAEAAPSPFARANTAWGPRTALVSIGAVAKPAATDERKPLALTLAIDCSGSMAQPGGLDRIRQGLLSFVEHLRAEDRVAIVAFGDQARVILPATPGNDRTALTNALANLATGGATNAAEGLGLAYQLAAETAAPERESRVLLATDGGTVAGADDLLRRVTAFKDRGITLVVVGTGATYRAGPLQELASKGDGQHFYVGSDADAQALFNGRLLPDRLAVLAKDAKLQVTWNPQRVGHARLIGYDQRRLAAKDFRNNAVDAGELSQDTQVTALFEVLLVDGGTGPLGTAAVRYHDMRRNQVRELACPLPGTILQSQPSDRLRLLACAAATAEWLQRGWWSNVHLITPQEIAAQLARCPQPIAQDLRTLLK